MRVGKGREIAIITRIITFFMTWCQHVMVWRFRIWGVVGVGVRMGGIRVVMVTAVIVIWKVVGSVTTGCGVGAML
jgi:hypothetical protein